MQKILSHIRRAVDDYEMISGGDRVAVGVSGGKDSLTLLCALARLRMFYPKPFELFAITLDMGYEGVDFSKVAELCKSLDVNYTVKKTNIKEVVFDIRNEKNPCSLCAKMRRGALHETAVELGCKKVALGHHNDDVIETFFLSLFFEGRVSCFSPVTYLDKCDLNLIRPMIYLPEKEIKRFVKKNDIPVVSNPCPADGYTKRQEMKEMIQTLRQKDKGIKKRLFTAIQTSDIEGWKL